jgi:hypothetical protein
MAYVDFIQLYHADIWGAGQFHSLDNRVIPKSGLQGMVLRVPAVDNVGRSIHSGSLMIVSPRQAHILTVMLLCRNPPPQPRGSAS